MVAAAKGGIWTGNENHLTLSSFELWEGKTSQKKSEESFLLTGG